MIRDLVQDLAIVPKTARAALVRRVDIHEVYIGGKVQLVATEFAHTNNAEATGTLYPISVGVHGNAVQRRQPAYACLESCLYDTVSQSRQVCSRFLHTRQATEITGSNAEQVLLGERPQHRGHLAFPLCTGQELCEFCGQYRWRRWWRPQGPLQQPEEELRTAPEDAAQQLRTRKQTYRPNKRLRVLHNSR